MKKFLYTLASVAAISLAMTGCKPDYEGTSAGGDGEPVVTLYSFEPELPYSADNDLKLRVQANNQTSAVYVLVDKADAKFDAARVVAEGKKYEVSLQKDGSYSFDAYLTNMQGDVIIAAVPVNGGSTGNVKTVSFKGLEWQTMSTGTYTFKVASIIKLMGVSTKETTLQKCNNVDGLYRFKDLFAEGYSLKFYGTGEMGSDDDGNFEYIYVPANKTPFTYGTYGEVGARDVYTWQSNNPDYLQDGLYENGSVWIRAQYFVSAGSLGYGWEHYTPSEN